MSMKHRKDFGKIAARGARVALCLLLTAVLFAVPVFAASEADSATVPFYFTPIGMAAILFVAAMCIVGIVAWIRSCARRSKDITPTVIPLEPKLPGQSEEADSFERDVDRYAKEEAEKQAKKDKLELNRAINEVLYAEQLAAWRDSRKAEEPETEEQTAPAEEVAEAPAAPALSEPAEEPGEDISGDLADRVERRTDQRTGADDVTGTDPLTAKAAAYHTAFEEAKNISADASDAIELTEDEDIAPAVSGALAEELEQSEQSLAGADEETVGQAVADIRDSALSDEEEPIDLVEEDVENPTLAVDETETGQAVQEVLDEAVAEEPEPEPEPEPESEEPLAAAAFAEVTEEEPEEDEPDEEEDEDGEDDGEDDAADSEPLEDPAAFGGQRITYIDAKANPEAYAELLAREARGEVTLVYRYRRSFLSKMAMADETVKGYYNEVKNALLAYKGVKCRTSWGYEAFNRGRIKLARMDIRTKSLYLYLAIDPASLADTKYTFKDMSAKKKYAATPVLMKIRGERKFRHALELIEKICGEALQLKRLEQEPVDYRLPAMSQEEMVEAGYMKMMVGAIPNPDYVPAEPEESAPADPTASAAGPAEADAAATELNQNA